LKLIALILSLFSFSSFAESSLIYEAKKKEIKLTEQDEKILSIGEISTARYVTGGILGTYPLGFGVGHAVQGRWSEDGWKFTAGELGSLTLLVAGLIGCIDNALSADNCSDVENTLAVTGFIGFIGFRIWEIVDVWAAPPSYNKKYKELKNYIEKTSEKKDVKTSLDLTPLYNPRMGQGLGLRFTF